MTLSQSPAERGTTSLAVGVLAWSGSVVFALSLGWFFYSYVFRFGRPATSTSAWIPAAVNVLLFTVFAVHHSLVARPGVKRWLRRLVSPAAERSLYTWIASVLFLLVVTWWQPVPGVLYEMEGPWTFVGYAVQTAGLALTLGAASAVDVLDLAGVRAYLTARSGRPPRHVPLETGGAYRLVRHPLYLAWALLVFGAPDMTGTRAVFAVVSTAYLALAIPWEERSLIDVFGTQYERYRRRVRWRMIPGIY